MKEVSKHLRSTPSGNANRQDDHGPDMKREIEKEQEEIDTSIVLDALVDVSIPKDKRDGNADKHDQ